MKLSLNWLKDYIDPKLSVDDLTHRLVMAGWEVEAVESHGKDMVLELEITPNRPDCLNILGLAREIGAITSKVVSYPKTTSYKTTKTKIAVSIQDKKDCRRYVATLLKEGVIKDSPKGIQERIGALGLKTISNAVDITNFVLMETGQPLHVFDYDKIEGGKITVRRAKEGEKIITIDGVERKLDPSILIIADEKKPIAIAGIMGGKDTEVSATTTNILLESAHFDMTLVRRASRKLGLRSDSSYRFERNVDFDGVLNAANRATDLLVDVTQAKVIARSDISISNKSTSKAIKITQEDVQNRLGISFPIATIKKILINLDFKVSGTGKALNVIAPCFRGDIKETVDLVEEVARIIGFDRLPTSLPQIKAHNLTVDPRPSKIKRSIRQALISSGVDEAVTLSMTNTRDLAKCLLQDVKSVKVFNPLTIDQELMRPSLLPALLQVVSNNFNRGQKNLRLYEIANIYLSAGERTTLGVLLTGARHQDWRLSRKEQVEYVDLKGILQNIFCTLGVNAVFEPCPQVSLEDSSATRINIHGKNVGYAGRLQKVVLSNWDIKNQDVYFAQIDLQELFLLPSKTIRFEPVVEFPAIVRDVSIAVKKETTYGTIEHLCRQNGGEILKNIQFIEQYIGDKVASDQKALVFSLVYQNNRRTLREEEVTVTHNRIIEALTKNLGATRR